MTTSRLLRRALRHYATRLLPVAGLLIVLCGGVTTLAAVHASSVEAVRESVRLGLGDQAYAVQTRESDDPTLRTLADSSLDPITDGRVEIRTDRTAATVGLRRYAAADLRLSALVDGRFPTATGEGVVSVATAEQLAVGLGDTLAVGDAGVALEVVGIGVDPTRIDALTAEQLVDSVPAGEATAWVSASDPYEMDDLLPLFDAEALTMRTVERLADDEAADAMRRGAVTIATVRNVLGAVTVWLLLVALPSLAALVRPAVVGLRAAGLAEEATRRLVVTGLSTLVVGSAGLGCLTALTVLWVARVPVSRLLDQRWSTVAVPVVPLVALIGGLVAAVLLAELVRTRRAQLHGGLGRSTRRATSMQVTVAAVGNLLLALGIAGSIPLLRSGAVPPDLTLVLVLAAVVTTPATAVALALLTARRSSHRAVLLSTLPAVAALAVAVAALTGLASAHTARAVHDDRSSAAIGGGAQPPGSLAVYQVPTALTADILTAYADLGGDETRQWLLPVETGTYLRATQPHLLECMERQQIADPFDALDVCYAGRSDDDLLDAQIEIVALDPDATEDVVGSAGLVQDGVLGFLVYDDTTGDLARVARTDGVASEDWLGGNLPGAVVAVDGDIAAEFGLQPSGSSLLFLADFADLEPEAQAELRGVVARLAGAAQIAEDNPRLQSERTRLAWFVAVASTGLLSTLVLFAGTALAATTRSVSLAVRSTGGSVLQRARLASLLFAPLAASAAVAASWGVFVAWLVGVKDGLGFGIPWLLPPLGVAVATAVLVTRWATCTPRDDR